MFKCCVSLLPLDALRTLRLRLLIFPSDSSCATSTLHCAADKVMHMASMQPRLFQRACASAENTEQLLERSSLLPASSFACFSTFDTQLETQHALISFISTVFQWAPGTTDPLRELQLLPPLPFAEPIDSNPVPSSLRPFCRDLLAYFRSPVPARLYIKSYPSFE